MNTAESKCAWIEVLMLGIKREVKDFSLIESRKHKKPPSLLLLLLLTFSRLHCHPPAHPIHPPPQRYLFREEPKTGQLYTVELKIQIMDTDNCLLTIGW